MIRVLIVDDEFLVRVGLKTFVAWEEQGFELIGEAGNGKEAMGLLENNRCDIILTDICMPEMDGLTLLQQVKEKYPHIRSFILSNHDDFDYVRKALQIGALDYVLKLTMEPQELVEKLLKVKLQIEEERKDEDLARQLSTQLNVFKKEAREKRLREIITKMCSRKEIEEVFREFDFAAEGRFHLVNLQIDQYEQVLDENKFQSEKLLSYSVANIVLELFKNEADGELIELENGKFCLLLRSYSNSFLDEVRQCIHKYLKLSVCCGVSDSFDDISRMHAAYLEAERALQYCFYAGLGQAVHHRQVHYAPSAELPAIVPKDEWKRMIDQRNEEGMLLTLRKLYERMDRDRKWHPDDVREQWIRLVHLFADASRELGGDIYSMQPHEGRYPFHAARAVETLNGMYEWFRGWIPMYVQYMKECSNQQWRPEIRTAVRMIQEQYTTTIKLADLAKVIGFTEAYLSVLFKKETGETLMDFIIRLRMKKARELLRDPSMKIYEVSEAVGYADANYFGKLFKKVEGIYPQEYKKKYFNK